MKLFYSAASPYARKVRVLAHELGLHDRIEAIATTVSPVEVNADIAGRNPLAKLPTLELDDGSTLYDSRVIVQYLLSLAPQAAGASSDRWGLLRREALADGILDAALLARYEEALRPAEFRWPAWQAQQEAKVLRGIAQCEAEVDALASALGDAASIGQRVDVIAIGCMLGYLDLRFARLDWRRQAPRLAAFDAAFAQRPSMLATRS